MFNRRRVLVSAAALAPSFGAGRVLAAAADPFAALERKSGGRLGVAALDLKSGRRLAHRAGERFAMCSTFKFLLAAAVLKRVDGGREQLDRLLPFGQADLLPYSPTTTARVAESRLSVGDLCEAAITVSDNTAANLLLATLGGPAGLTAFARSLGDNLTRLDRIETALNEARPGDPRDTTSPAAMLADMRTLLLGPVLKPASRERLTGWLVANKTGGKRIRAGLPAAWKAGDKTGANGRGTTNDIAILWPDAGQPILLTVYLTASPLDDDACNAVVAEAAKIAAGLLRAEAAHG